MGFLISREFSVEAIQFGLKFAEVVSRCRRGNERATPETGILEATVKPHAELPGDLERGERAAVVAGQGMACRVAGAPDFAEELGNLAGEDALCRRRRIRSY